MRYFYKVALILLPVLMLALLTAADVIVTAKLRVCIASSRPIVSTLK